MLCCSYFEVFASAILRSSSLQQLYGRLRFSNSTVVFVSAILRSSSLQQFYGRLRFSNSTVVSASAILRSSSHQQLYGPLRISNSTVLFASAILQSSSLTDWSLRNIHFSNGKGPFSFYKIVSFCLRRTMNCLTLARAWVHHACLMGPCCSSDLVFCLVLCLSSPCVSCAQCCLCLLIVHS